MDRLFAVSMLLFVAACGGDGGGSGPGAPPPVQTPPPADPFAAIRAEIADFPVSDMVFILGDAGGRILTIEKGVFRTSDPFRIASASKWVTGYSVYSLVEAGALDLSDRPQAYLPFWASDPADPRRDVTLEQLLSFTSGFDYAPEDPGCTNDPFTTIAACAEDYHDRGLLSPPGTRFVYGDAHMQIAAAMVEGRLGESWQTFFAADIAPRFGFTAVTDYDRPSRSNPRVAAGITSTVDDYEKFLRAMLTGEGLSDPAAFRRSRTEGVMFASRVNALDELGLEWAYGLGFWIECDEPGFPPQCAEEPVLSSPGGFGTTPWIDLGSEYYAMIAMEETNVAGSPASVASVGLEQRLQPLIEAALAARP